MKKEKQSIEEKAFVTADLAALQGRKLPTKAQMEERVNNPSLSDLVLDNILIGRRVVNFKEFFLEHAPLILALRESLPQRGPNCKIAVKDGEKVTLYSWSEFVAEFYRVSDAWLRQLLSEFRKSMDPNCQSGEGDEQATNLQDKISRKDALKQAVRKAIEMETRATNYRLELQALVEQIEKFRDEVPDPLYRMAVETKERICPVERPEAGVAETIAEIDSLFKKVAADQTVPSEDE
jgi:hypothetical protein